MAKKGMKKVDWREPESAAPKAYKWGEREEEALEFMNKIAPTQKVFQSKASEDGERIGAVWQPYDIGTENFKESTSTAYLRKMDY